VNSPALCSFFSAAVIKTLSHRQINPSVIYSVTSIRAAAKYHASHLSIPLEYWKSIRGATSEHKLTFQKKNFDSFPLQIHLRQFFHSYFFSPAQQSNLGRWHLTVKVQTVHSRRKQPVGLLWTSDQLITDVATYVTYNTHKRRASMSSAGFETTDDDEVCNSFLVSNKMLVITFFIMYWRLITSLK